MARDMFLLRWAKLYSNPTPAEAALEPAIAALGIPYRFQHPLWGLRVFPDFVLPRQKIVIEVDDPSHRTTKKRKEDAMRTEKLRRAGWRVVRCWNEDALANPYRTIRALLGDDFVETCLAARDARLIHKEPEADQIISQTETSDE